MATAIKVLPKFIKTGTREDRIRLITFLTYVQANYEWSVVGDEYTDKQCRKVFTLNQIYDNWLAVENKLIP